MIVVIKELTLFLAIEIFVCILVFLLLKILILYKYNIGDKENDRKNAKIMIKRKKNDTKKGMSGGGMQCTSL